jgi:hypothetical protein
MDNNFKILKDAKWGNVGWIHLNKDMDKWQTFLKMVMSLHVS